MYSVYSYIRVYTRISVVLYKKLCKVRVHEYIKRTSKGSNSATQRILELDITI